MDLGTAIETVDHAVHQDDRWMFVALLVFNHAPGSARETRGLQASARSIIPAGQ